MKWIFFLNVLLQAFFFRMEAQTRDSIYYKNFVKHSDGSLCVHTAPTSTFVFYLNGDQNKILTENSPRWSLSPDPNIDGKGVFGVELGNFINPGLKVGDSVFVRFTCSARGEQGVLSDVVNNIPPVQFPLFLNLAKKNIPLPVNCFVTLKIFNVLGQEVTTLVNEWKNAGRYTVEWNGENQPSGVYLYRLQAGSFQETRKMILLR